MAVDKKKKYKAKGGPKRKSYLNKIAQKGRAGREYLKFGDITPSEVHEGDVTYRGVTLSDDAPIANYSVNVFRAEGKEYFIHKSAGDIEGKLYKSTGGASPTKVMI